MRGVVVVWTRTRLGLPVNAVAPDNKATNDAPVIRGAPPIEGGGACALPVPADTDDFPIYAILGGLPSRPVAKKLWTAYTDSVRSVIKRWSVLPTDLMLPTFGPAFTADTDAGGQSTNARVGNVAPTVSSVLVLTLDSSGALTSARVAASALSGPIDTSMLAGLERAAEAHAFPSFPGGRSSRDFARFDVLVTSSAGDRHRRRRLGTLGGAGLAARAGGASTGGLDCLCVEPHATHGVTVQLVVDSHGRPVSGTVRMLTGPAGADRASPDSGYRHLFTQQLNQLRFEPAQIGSCPVPQLVTQSVAVPAGSTDSK